MRTKTQNRVNRPLPAGPTSARGAWRAHGPLSEEKETTHTPCITRSRQGP